MEPFRSIQLHVKHIFNVKLYINGGNDGAKSSKQSKRVSHVSMGISVGYNKITWSLSVQIILTELKFTEKDTTLLNIVCC